MNRLLRTLQVLAPGAVLLACGGDPGASSVGEDITEDRTEGEIAIPTIDTGSDSETGSIDAQDTDDTDGSAPTDCRTLGCPCTTDPDCDSGYCIDGADGDGRICSELCSDDCSLPDYECVVLVNSGGDAVRLCVPEDRRWCEPCTDNRSCARLGDLCLETLDGRHCATDCSGNQSCPQGASCTEVENGGVTSRVCIPDDGVCGACLDRDADGFGFGDDCRGLDCDDSRADVFPGAPEVCDGVDNNCNSLDDEGFDVQGDPLNCGSCGTTCAAASAITACEAGVCVVQECLPGFDDCDGLATNGCEAAVDARNACGGCLPLDAEPGASCGICASGEWACDGTDALICTGDDGPPFQNACGGCDPLPSAPGTACGTCGGGTWTCSGTEAVTCASDPGTNVLNACGGCTTLSAAVGSRCGTCDSGVLVCGGTDALTCVGDLGASALNACGGCGALSAIPESVCGPCNDGRWVCDGAGGVRCNGATPDSDSDGACDNTDICPGFDDRVDSDSDGTPNGCDRCPGFDDRVDSDSDGITDGCDRCTGFNDLADADGDTIPDACDCNQAGCSADATCAESSTGAVCTCRVGFTGDGRTCAPVTCPNIPNPANGTIALSGNSVGSTATTSCNIGWTLQGDAVRTCTNAGTWSGTAAICFRPPGNLWCVCNQTYSAGDRIVTTVANPSGAPGLPAGRGGTVLAGNDNQGSATELLVAFDSWSGGHNGRCQAVDCGNCSESGSNKYYVSCASVRPAGP